MATSPRDARRRRIVDRGSDRLALITGRIQNLPSSSPGSESQSQPQPQSHHSYTASCPTSLSEHDLSLEHPSPAVFSEGEHKASSGGGTKVQPLMRKCETRVEASRPSSDLDFHDSQPFPDSPTVHSPLISSSSRRASHFQSRKHNYNLFTPNQITSAVSASHTTRIYCSLAAAILVVLCYVGFPILGSRLIKSIVLYKPLYLLLLTNISIVFSRLLLGKHNDAEKDSDSFSSTGEFGFADALELGLLLQNTLGALFMDCSVYSVVVVCGLSVAQKLGW